MKKRGIISLLALVAMLSLTACGGSKQGNSDAKANDTTQEQASGDKETSKGKPFKWAQGFSGNVMVTIAQDKGYFKDEGVEVEEIQLDNHTDAFAALNSGKVDICSNSGTNMPLQHIGAGEDVTIFGGHMESGSMPVIAKKGVKWNGPEDLIGKKVAGEANFYPITGPLYDKGYDPVHEIEWIPFNSDNDRVMAVKNGEVDYGVIGTNQMKNILESDDIEVLAYVDEILPNYSCCRMATRGELIKERPDDFKKILKALIRAHRDFIRDREAAVELTVDHLNLDHDTVAAYMLNDEHYIINPDPLKNSCIRAWDWLLAMGYFDEGAKDINVEDHINTELYKEALDELIKERRDEDPEYYDEMLKSYEEHNEK